MTPPWMRLKPAAALGGSRPRPATRWNATGKGLMLIPDRRVFVARLDGLIAGSIQLHLNPRNNEAQAVLGRVTTAFVATWARG